MTEPQKKAAKWLNELAILKVLRADRFQGHAQ